MIHVLIDDVRDLPGMDIICRTPEAGMLVCKNLIDWHLYLDHDLGLNKDSGYDVLYALLYIYKKYPNKVQIVSSNPVGVDNIIALLKNVGYVQSDGTGINYEITR